MALHDAGVHGPYGMARLIPLMDSIESRFDIKRGTTWMARRWHISIAMCAVYLLLIYVGRRWMRDRKPFNLRRPLVMWNTGLAVFSFLGSWVLVPPFLRLLVVNGLWSTACYAEANTIPRQAVWGYMFGLFKVVELGDTAFIVLRKTPLSFLHWYHHMTVFVFCWYTLIDPTPVTQWFGVMNYTIHTVMYTYYALKASGWRIPSRVALVVTLMQLSQMFVGVIINVMAYMQQGSCKVRVDLLQAAAVMYASYAILFLNFLYHRYIKKKQ